MRRSAASVLVVLAACSSDGTDDQTAEPLTAPIKWQAPDVLLKARSIFIDAGAQAFVANDESPQLWSSFPTDGTYTTLESTWQEHDVQMRLFIYFASDLTDWWATEIRHYDGNAEGEWVTYTGDYFRSEIGQAFIGDLSLATLEIHDMFLKAFLPRCNHAPLSIDLAVQVVEVGSAGFNFPLRVLDENCQPTAVPAGATFEWSTDDPSIATVAGDASAVKFTYVGDGTTMAGATLRGDQGDILASVRFPVIAAE